MIFTNIKKVLYIGDALNIQFIKDFVYIKDYTVIDFREKNSVKKKFFKNLVDIYKKNGFELLYIEKLNKKKKFSFKKFICNILGYSYIEPSILIFMNFKTSQQIRYYISTNLNNLTDLIEMEIDIADILLINNKVPNEEILRYFRKSKILIGYNSNLYKQQIETKNIYKYFLYQSKNTILKYFNDFYLYDEIKHQIFQYYNFNDFYYSNNNMTKKYWNILEN